MSHSCWFGNGRETVARARRDGEALPYTYGVSCGEGWRVQLRIVSADLDDLRVVALLRTHVTAALANTGRGSGHALEASDLRDGALAVWAAWDGEVLLGVGALRRLSAAHAEVKSMHTAEAARGRGVGRAMLAHILAKAREAGCTRVSLETGAWPFFAPAHALYRGCGFVPCGPFEGYGPDPNSLFFTLAW